MHSIILTFVSLVVCTTAFAASLPKDSVHLKRQTVELFLSGKSSAAVALLQSNSSLRPAPGVEGATVALVQSLVEVATTLYNERRLTSAREVLSHALAAAEPVVTGRSAAAAAQRAALLSSLGLLSEHVAFDQRRAEAFYDAAAALDPSDRLHRDRKQALVHKYRTRK